MATGARGRVGAGVLMGSCVRVGAWARFGPAQLN